MKERFRPHPENPKQHAPEAGAGPLGLPPPSPERHPLPSVWDVLERDVSLEARDAAGQIGHEEYDRELREVERLRSELREKGTARDKLILDLYSAVTLELGGLPAPLPYNRTLPREEFKQFCSKVDPLSEAEIAEEIHKAKEEFKRRAEASLCPPTPS